ncbi:hypothetical protein [Anaerotignum sp. MSJ-24]|uniref:hypothetical protein n=1 Tax=Anaerotignum sp. MSJ-24 TaxID=2841521 RepID=UPI001C11B96E|nr:hypothetical protein [Anaerotignum sp. MSJ-24]MBU5463694.1 hypothetical protein [Anaerotignum sp. MSJ-24]
MKFVNFTEEDKIKMFDEIASHFYNANFGQMSKTDIELLMFHFYIEKMVSENSSEDGIIDYNKCSDYKISHDLGITQQRVRNLKIKNQLVYPIEYDWKLALAKLTENARYDKVSKKIIMNIPDPNLYLEIQNFIEEKGAYVEKQLNSKILQIRVEYYIELALALENVDNQKKFIKKLKQFFKDKGKNDNEFDENNIGKSLIEMAVNITEIVANISNVIPNQSVVWTSLFKLITK